MGLDTSHDAWHGAYSAFMRWRQEIAKAAGLPPLTLMEGFYQQDDPIHDPMWQSVLDRGARGDNPTLENVKAQLPIKWECLKPSPLHQLLHHSDCDGEIPWKDCGMIAVELEKVLPNLPKDDAGGHIGDFRDKTQTFINGLRKANAAKENLEFH